METKLSEVEGHGKKTLKSKDQDTKCQSQERKSWDRRIKQDSTGKNVCVENVGRGKQKDSGFRHDDIKRGKKTQSSKIADTKRRKKTFERNSTKRQQFFGKKISKSVQKLLYEIVMRLLAFFPYVKIINLNRDAKFGGQKKEEHEWAIEKPKLDNARMLRGINFTDPNEKELCSVSCKLKTFRHRETWSESNEIRKSKHACIVEAHESARKRSESTLPKNHEDQIADKGFNSLSHYNFVHKFVPMPQPTKIPEARAAVGNRIGKWPKTRQKKGHLGSTKRAKNSPLRYADGPLSSQKWRVRNEVSKIQRPGCALKWHSLSTTGCVNRTPALTACTDAHSVSTHHIAQSDHFSSREHAWLKNTSLGVAETFCHPRVMSLTLPHLTLTTSTSSLTYLFNFTVILSDTPKPVDSRSRYTLRRFTAELWFHGSPMSHRLWAKRSSSTGILRLNIKI